MPELVEAPEFIRLPYKEWTRLVSRFENIKGMLNYTTLVLRGFEEENKALRKQIRVDQQFKILEITNRIEVIQAQSYIVNGFYSDDNV